MTQAEFDALMPGDKVIRVETDEEYIVGFTRIESDGKRTVFVSQTRETQLPSEYHKG